MYSIIPIKVQASKCRAAKSLSIQWSYFRKKITEILFVPYALTDYNKYTSKVKEVLDPWGFNVTGIHTYADPAYAINSAQAIYIGGGNTFLLLKTLYDNNLVELIRKRVTNDGVLYMGSSAGSNVATRSIHTTNDMPITYPPSFNAIGIVPFNINPHFIDKVESETHKGETREQRILEYLQMDHAKPVLGLREGAVLHVDGDSLQIRGVSGAVLFRR